MLLVNSTCVWHPYCCNQTQNGQQMHVISKGTSFKEAIIIPYHRQIASRQFFHGLIPSFALVVHIVLSLQDEGGRCNLTPWSTATYVF